MNGNPIAAVPVTFAAPASAATATLSAATVTTDSGGRASITASANNFSGTYQISATAADITTPAIFALTNLPPSITQLNFTQQPSNSTAGTVIAPPVRVQVQDANRTAANIAGLAVTLELSQGVGVLSGTLMQLTDSSGTATFSDLSIDATGPKRLRAISTGQTPAESNEFTVNVGSPSNITALGGSGQAAELNAQFGSPLQALVTDAYNNPIPNVEVTFTVPANGASATFSASSVIITDASGIATSPDLTANGTAGAYLVKATTAGLLGQPRSH